MNPNWLIILQDERTREHERIREELITRVCPTYRFNYAGRLWTRKQLDTAKRIATYFSADEP